MTARVLIACEMSGVLRRAFRRRGFDAWSVDVLPSEDGSPYHITGCALAQLDGGWDMMVAHPPCTHLAVSGARWFAAKRRDGRQQAALDFVRSLLDAPIDRIALENPVSVISTAIRKPDQTVQPWMFGDAYSKTTCWWLKGLPLLRPTHIVGRGDYVTTPSGRRVPAWYSNLPKQGRARARSRTFPGMASAIADQWGGELCTEKKPALTPTNIDTSMGPGPGGKNG